MPERGRFEDDSVRMTRTSHGLEASLPPLAGGPDAGQGAQWGGGGGSKAGKWEM